MISLPRPCDNIFKYRAVTVNYINKYIYNIKVRIKKKRVQTCAITHRALYSHFSFSSTVKDGTVSDFY